MNNHLVKFLDLEYTPLTSGQGILPLSVDREYCVIISNKYLTYSDGSLVHQSRLNNSYHN